LERLAPWEVCPLLDVCATFDFKLRLGRTSGEGRVLGNIVGFHLLAILLVWLPNISTIGTALACRVFIVLCGVISVVTEFMVRMRLHRRVGKE
jgi:hypothetical protein